MSFYLPPPDHAARELFDPSHLAELQASGQWATLKDARYSARRTFENEPGVRAVHCICMRANGDIQLVRFGPRGGWRKVWNFSRRPRRVN